MWPRGRSLVGLVEWHMRFHLLGLGKTSPVLHRTKRQRIVLQCDFRMMLSDYN
jgi:hypothetical protein